MRDLVRQAAGSVTGKTVAAQVRQAARHLDYPPESWRVRDGWYGRAGTWSAAAVEDLRRRFVAWREKADGVTDPRTAAQRIASIRQGLAGLMRQVDELAAEIAMTVDGPR